MAYKKALKYVTEKASNFCHSREAEYMLLSTKDDIKELFLNKMIQRGIIQ